MGLPLRTPSLVDMWLNGGVSNRWIVWSLTNFEPSVSLLKHIYRFMFRSRKVSHREWALTRTACFGNDVLRLAAPNLRKFNFQKGRVDHLIELLHSQGIGLKRRVPFGARRFLADKKLWPLVHQQNIGISRKCRAPKFLFLDSYSDLTDQKFVNVIEQFEVYSHYSDLDLRSVPQGVFLSEGLLDLTDYKEQVRAVILAVERAWGKVPIFLLTYPIALETRNSFVERAKLIRNVYSELSSEFEFVVLIDFTDFEAEMAPEDSFSGEIFPYHYAGEVYAAAAESVRTAFAKLGLS